MERSAWTDQRLDAEFSGLRQDIRDLRAELREDMRDLETGLRGEIADLRSLMIRLHATTVIAFLGVIAAIFARGA